MVSRPSKTSRRARMVAHADPSSPDEKAAFLLPNEARSSNRSSTASLPSQDLPRICLDHEDAEALSRSEAVLKPQRYIENNQPHFEAHTRVEADQPISPLLRLPPELRNRLYKHVFTTQDSTVEVGRRYCVQVFALTETCKQIRDESSALPYRLNSNLSIYVDKLDRLSQLAAQFLARKDDCKLQNVSLRLR